MNGDVPAAAPVSPVTVAWRYDPAEWKRGKRAQREKGCWVYIARDELVAAGIDPEGPPPLYRVRGYQRSRNAGSAIVDLRRAP